MNNITKLADQFLQMVERESPLPTKVAAGGRLSKKTISKQLEKDRNNYNTLRLSVEQKEKSLKDLNEALDRDRKDLQSCRTNVLKAYEVLKNMDLVDSNEVKMMGEDVGYIKNKKMYRLETDKDGNVVLAPFKKKKDEPEEELEEESFSTDDLLASLTE